MNGGYQADPIALSKKSIKEPLASVKEEGMGHKTAGRTGVPALPAGCLGHRRLVAFSLESHCSAA
jgi:hypothetical protein